MGDMKRGILITKDGFYAGRITVEPDGTVTWVRPDGGSEVLPFRGGRHGAHPRTHGVRA